jgi:NAD(P)H dehydrogenase (quinone)
MSIQGSILVTGAAGNVGNIGGTVVEILRRQDVSVKAFVRRDDERAAALRRVGADVFVGDLTRTEDVARALENCRRIYFGMSISPTYLEAAVGMGAAARDKGDIEVLVNMSQMTVSQMTLRNMSGSLAHRQHWLAEQALGWSGVPLVNIRPTAYQESPFFLPWAAEQIARDNVIRLPFGLGRTSPVAAQDVAEVVATILLAPQGHVGKTYHLTGPRSQDAHGLASEYSAALGRSITYVDTPIDEWRDKELSGRRLPEYLVEHLLTMARLHAENKYDRLSPDVEAILGRPARSLELLVKENRKSFGVR